MRNQKSTTVKRRIPKGPQQPWWSTDCGGQVEVTPGNTQPKPPLIALTDFNLAAIASKIKPLTPFRVEHLQSDKSSLVTGAALQEQLERIKSLYGILKQLNPKAKEPEWTLENGHDEVLHWIYTELDKCFSKEALWRPGRNGFGITDDIDFVEEKYALRVLYVVENSAHYPMDLCFLPNLKKSNVALHNLVIDVVAMLVKKTHIRLWDNDYYISVALDYLSSRIDEAGYMVNDPNAFQEASEMEQSTKELAEELKGMKKTFAQYTDPNSMANQYARIIRKRIGQNPSMASVQAKARRCDARGRLERNILTWCKSAVPVIKIGEPIANYSHMTTEANPDYMEPVMPTEYYRFVWDGNDWIGHETDEVMDAQYQEGGSMQPHHCQLLYAGRKIKPFVKSSFMAKLNSLMHFGCRIRRQNIKKNYIIQNDAA